MTAAQFFIDPLPDGDRFRLTGEEGRHAARVRRVAVGEALIIGDGRGTVADCVVAAVRPDGLELSVRARRFVPAAAPRLIVVQAVAKGDRAQLAVETMTELGVDEIVPWSATRSVAQWRGERMWQRWQRTAREAAKQSRRAWIPVVRAVDELPPLQDALVLHESARLPLVDVPLPTGEVVVVVGPEGGLTDEELARFTAAGATPVRLGVPVLRTSTAGAAALAALSVRLGRWS